MFELKDIVGVILTGKKYSVGVSGDFIKFTAPNGTCGDFEIYAGVNYKNGFYLIVRPMDVMVGVEEDEGLVFKRNPALINRYTLVDDEFIMQEVFEEYYKMLQG